MDFWNARQKGANFFNHVETSDRLAALKKYRFSISRMVFNKWDSKVPGTKPGDFLFGSLDDFKKLVPEDLARLREVLDAADVAGVKVIVSTLSLPGARWKQQNGDKLDSRLWTDFKYHDMAADFWKQLATALKGHPAVAAYNIINEPYPEAVPPVLGDWYTGDYAAWYTSVKGSPADLNAFYRKVAAAIREVDTETPLMLDSGFYSTPWAFKVLEPLKDTDVLYAFHMYEPYAFTNYRQDGSIIYPGKIAIGEAKPAPVLEWNRPSLKNFFSPVKEWQAKYQIPPNRVIASEFGVSRKNEGADPYLSDLAQIFTQNGWHWAFYSFREDTWPGMDYELGKFKLPDEYFKQLDLGKDTRELYYLENPLFNALLRGL